MQAQSKHSPTNRPSTPGFYTLEQVLNLYPISKATLYREIRDERFPAQVRLSRNRVGWPRAAVDSFLAERAASVA